jgi:Lipopolysaccharide kinase (Kdo/WaaP) family
MPSDANAVPSGYVAFAIGGVEVVSARVVAGSIRAALESGSATLYDYASRHKGARPLAGRGIAYAAPLPPPDGARVVVRHNRHGGLFGPFTRDLFRAPTRAPLELEASVRLAAAGVPTPELLAYAVYPAPFGFRRADVATREVPDSFDLSAVLTRADESLRARAWAAVADLLRRLAAAGARHHDLNVKNVLLRPSGDALEALALDVDRVTFERDDVMTANVARLSRSARKWRERQGATLDESELAVLARSVFEASLSAVTRS